MVTWNEGPIRDKALGEQVSSIKQSGEERPCQQLRANTLVCSSPEIVAQGKDGNLEISYDCS